MRILGKIKHLKLLEFEVNWRNEKQFEEHLVEEKQPPFLSPISLLVKISIRKNYKEFAFHLDLFAILECMACYIAHILDRNPFSQSQTKSSLEFLFEKIRDSNWAWKTP